MSVGIGMFKDSSFLGTFTLPLPPLTQIVAHINMISYITNGSLKCVDPWVVKTPFKIESYEAQMFLTMVDIM
jgi:hypothetical protein